MRLNYPISRKLIILAGANSVYILSLFISLICNGLPADLQWTVENNLTLGMVMVGFNIIFLLANGLLSLYKMSFYQLSLSCSVTVCQMFIVMLAGSFITSKSIFSLQVVTFASCIQFFMLFIWLLLFWRLENAFIGAKNVFLVGTRSDCSKLLPKLSAQYRHLRYSFRSHETDLMPVDDSFNENLNWAQVIILSENLSLGERIKLINTAHIKEIEVVILPDIANILTHQLVLDRIEDVPVFRAKKLFLTAETRALKRIIDIFFSAIMLTVLVPFMVLIFFAVKLDSPGPAIFRQIRVGQGGCRFYIYKFRTMIENAEKHTGPVLAAEKDPRITRVGQFLRATRMDELPQLWNVLCGDMSIVGPRPERPAFVKEFEKQIPSYRFRHNVQPGITGLAQVAGRYDTSTEDKLVYDLFYIQKASAFYDLMIMLRTIKVLFMRETTRGIILDDKAIQSPQTM